MFGIKNETETGLSFLQELGLHEDMISEQFRVLAETEARYLRDLKINVNNVLSSETISKKESYLLAFAVAINEKNDALRIAFSEMARKEGATEKEIADIISCTSLLSANNVYYRFRHFMNDETYNNSQAGIRMGIMANPSIGKEFFELTSIVISALNGCELCVTSHEKTLVAHGTTKQRIHDAIRLGAVIRSLAVLV
jgi:lipoyl-dependent peroxiredoxin subunit D